MGRHTGDERRTTAVRAIDALLPSYDVSEQHARAIAAPVDRVRAEVRSFDLLGSTIPRVLFGLRTLPEILSGSRPPLRLGIADVGRIGFSVLADEPSGDLVVGTIGRFWSRRPELHGVDASRFVDFDEPGWAKAAMDVCARADGRDGTLLSTETRVLVTDARSRRLFLRYWHVVGPFSGWLRLSALGRIARASLAP